MVAATERIPAKGEEHAHFYEVKNAASFKSAVGRLLQKATENAAGRSLNPLEHLLHKHLHIRPSARLLQNEFARYNQSSGLGEAQFEVPDLDLEQIPKNLRSRIAFLTRGDRSDVKIKVTKEKDKDKETSRIAIIKGRDLISVRTDGNLFTAHQVFLDEQRDDIELFRKDPLGKIEFAQQVVDFTNDSLEQYLIAKSKSKNSNTGI